MKRILLLLAAIMMTSAALAEGEVYRWTDENGKVHYGLTLPPEAANRPYEILSKNGVVIERIEDPVAHRLEQEKAPAQKEKKPEPLFSEHEVRLRSDRLLMLRYQSEDDIRDAMEVEVAQLGYDARLINQSMTSVLTALTAQVNKAANQQRAGMPPEEALTGEISQLRQRLQRNENSLAELREREEEIRATFLDDIERYRFLANGGAPGSTIEES
ncbi:MAG: DUF4124 domain-containing protein [Gammaproteobacteria bacterium]|nr:DUF4124 domain-containing protein [Gammaproteobacteria bacterium]NNE05699.1 DUF4124 domain-containing protein [Xanthomonadales bacterium]